MKTRKVVFTAFTISLLLILSSITALAQRNSRIQQRRTTQTRTIGKVRGLGLIVGLAQAPGMIREAFAPIPRAYAPAGPPPYDSYGRPRRRPRN
jgi:hypothetical protein